MEKSNSRVLLHFQRSRLNDLFIEAVRYPLVVVCAGAGYGKSYAVHDFTEHYQGSTTWIQLSERDNMGERFWENCIHAVGKNNDPLVKASAKLGFPDTKDKIKQYQSLLNAHVQMKQRIIVMDDFHYIQDPEVILFLEECVLQVVPPGTSVFLLARQAPHVNIAHLVSKNLMFNISENDLRFTENELSQYFKQLNIALPPDALREVMQDTGGWAFAINLIAHSYQKAPGYTGYVRSAMKSNIFKLMETEIWNGISNELQTFLISLSLIDHLSIDLVSLLADNNADLIAEFEKQNAYIRRDNYINAYLIHHLFLEFLADKQKELKEEQIQKTFSVAGQWCKANGFKIDALSYFEKTGDYSSIVSILHELPVQIPQTIAKYSSGILDKAPDEAFDSVEYLVMMHLMCYICQGLWKKSIELAKHYEDRFVKQAESPFRNRVLSDVYYCLGHLRSLMCTVDDVFDFETYFEKFYAYSSPPLDRNKLYIHCPGPWINGAGSSRKGSPDDYINSLKATSVIISKCFSDYKTGESELAKGEFKFYQGDYRSAETFIISALESAVKNKQYEITHRGLFYILRLGVAQGSFAKAEQALKEMKNQLPEEDYANRYINYDIALCWYYCNLGMTELVPSWLTESFSPYGHPAFTENFANQMKALYCYTSRNYPPLLSYINELKQRESFLFGRIEMLAMEACVHYISKDKKLSLAALKAAYETSAPNDIIAPFIELGKDMRTLTSFALKESECKLPKQWLENINRKAASYAKYQGHILAQYKQANRVTKKITVSPREAEILKDLSHGLSRAEIAANRGLSINTVKMVINNIYIKLGAENLADLIRIATELKMI